MTPDQIGAALTDLAELSAKSDREGKAISAASSARLAEIEAELVKLKAKALTDADAGERYIDRVMEAGRLHKMQT
jgi:uncharacterized protein YicC (UPF0701 family)